MQRASAVQLFCLIHYLFGGNCLARPARYSSNRVLASSVYGDSEVEVVCACVIAKETARLVVGTQNIRLE